MNSAIDSSATVRGVTGLQCESVLPPSVPLRKLLARGPCTEHLDSLERWQMMEAEAESDEQEGRWNNEQMHAHGRCFECHPNVRMRITS